MSDQNSHKLKYEIQFWLTQTRYLADKATYVQVALGPILDTVESFYSMYETLLDIASFSDIKEGGYSLFKKGLEPSLESIPHVSRYNIYFKQEDSLNYRELFLNFFLIFVSGKFDDICGIYTQKHVERPWKLEIWSIKDIDSKEIHSFLGEKTVDFDIQKRR